MQDRTTDIRFDGSARPLLGGLMLIQGFLGYEWFMSGLAKMLSGEFVSALGDDLTERSGDLTGPYKAFLDGIVIPNAQIFGYVVMIGELALGIGLIGLAAVWWFRWAALSFNSRSVLLGLIVTAGVIGVLMNVNFHLANGSPHPWLIAADPFDEGIDLDSVAPLIQLAISGVALVMLRRVRTTRAASVTPPTVETSTARA